MRRFACFLALFLCIGTQVEAATKRVQQPERSERVVAVKADGSLQVSTSGWVVFRDVVWPDPALAENWLAQHMLQQSLTFTPGEEDRYGRVLIESEAVPSALRDGAASIYNIKEKLPDSWRQAEAQARAAKQGVWAQEGFVLTPETAAKHIGEFHVVEGKITKIYNGKSATYLNFGDDWHTDFSVMIAGKYRRGLKPLLETLAPGSMLRVRGYIYEENGPMIALTYADNLEIK